MENKLACIILEGLNWGFDEQVCIEYRRPEPDQFFRVKVLLELGLYMSLTVNYILYVIAVHLIA